jgi:hypothetical protein
VTPQEEKQILQTLEVGKNNYYVYALCKGDRTPFYIGKGNGPRVLDHRKAAVQAQASIESDDTLTPEEKQKKIKELEPKLQTIIDQNTDLQMVIIKWGLTEKEALMCESTLINIIQFTKGATIGELTNNINGHASKAEKESLSDVKTKARSLETFLAECAIPERAINDIRENVVFIKINDFYPKCIDEEGCADNEKVKDCVRGIWPIAKNKRDKIRYVFALYHRRVVGIFHVRRVSKEIGVEYRSGLKGFPKFPDDARAIDWNIARFSSVEEAERKLDATPRDALLEFLKSRISSRRPTENAVLADFRERVYFELDDTIPTELAQFKNCLLKKEGRKKYFSGQYPLLFHCP